MSAPTQVLVVDDDPEMAKHVGFIARMAARPDWSVTPVHSAAAAIDAIGRHDPARARLVVVSDYNLGGGATGIDVFRAALERDPRAYLILMSGEQPEAVERALATTRPHRFLEKPFTVDAMQASLLLAAQG